MANCSDDSSSLPSLEMAFVCPEIDQDVCLTDKVTYFQMLSLVSSSSGGQQNRFCKNDPLRISAIADDALSQRPKQRFCVSSGDAGNDQYNRFAFVRRLLTISVSSPLGRRMVQFIETNLPFNGSNLNPYTVAHTLFGSGGTPEYGAFCRTQAVNALNSRWNWRQFPTRFRHSKCGYCHRYCFNRTDRQKFCKRFDTGLSSRSQNLRKRLDKCYVSLFKLTLEEIADWRISQRLRDIIENPCPDLCISLIESDDSHCEYSAVAKPTVQFSSASEEASSMLPLEKHASTTSAMKQSATKTVPLILKRQQMQKVSIPNIDSAIITLSSDSEDETNTAPADKKQNFIFNCHKCNTKIACSEQYSDMVKFHYRTVHNICNIDVLHQKQPSGETTLSIVQLPQPSFAASTDTNSRPVTLSMTNNSMMANSYVCLSSTNTNTMLNCFAARSSTHQNTITSVPVLLMSRRSLGGASVRPSISNVIAVAPQPRTVFVSSLASVGGNCSFRTFAPITPTLIDVSRRLVCDWGNSTIPAGSARKNNCSQSLITEVDSTSSALCESDVVCLD